MKPIKQRVSLIQHIIQEVILLPFNLCVLLLAILDAREIEARDERKTIGNIMVSINVIIPVLSMVFLAIKLSLISYNACCKTIKQKKPEKRKNFFRPQRLNLERRKATSLNRIIRHQRAKTILKASTFEERTNSMQVIEITQDISTSPEISTLNQMKINDGSVRLENSIMSEENSFVHHEATTAEFKSRNNIIEIIDEDIEKEVEWSSDQSPQNSKKGFFFWNC